MSTDNYGNPAPYPGQPVPPQYPPQPAPWASQTPPAPQPQPSAPQGAWGQTPAPQPQPSAPQGAWGQTPVQAPPAQAPWASQAGYGTQPPGWGGGYTPPPEKPKPPVALWALIIVVVVALIAAGVYLFTRPSPSPTTPSPTQTITLTPSYQQTNQPTDTSTSDVQPNGDQQPWYRDMSGQVTASADVYGEDLQVGDCVENISSAGDTVDTLAVVPCTTPHEAEVYAVGSDITNTKTQRTQFCQDAFQPYVGSNWNDSVLDVTWLYSTTGATTDVQCMVYQEGKMVTTTYKDSNM